MRYEAKHSYFKKMAQVVHNFKNIHKSLAKHHQRFMCYRMADKSAYLTSRNVYGTGKYLCLFVFFGGGGGGKHL